MGNLVSSECVGDIRPALLWAETKAQWWSFYFAMLRFSSTIFAESLCLSTHTKFEQNKVNRCVIKNKVMDNNI